jgi:signal transduction histidine kinase
MNRQFLKLYIVITISLIALVLAFGQLYNHLFSSPPLSVQLSVKELRLLIEHKEEKIEELNDSQLFLSGNLREKFENEGILTVTLEQQQYVYLKGDKQKNFRIGPINLTPTQTTNWLAFITFYLLLGGLILLFIRPVFRDLSILQNAAKRFSKKPEKFNLPIKPSSSIAPLAGTFTEMSERIENFIQLHSDLSRIISHEIRTPLTRMQFALSISNYNDEERDQLERDIEEIELRLEQYLSFARLEHQHSVFSQYTTNLNQLIETEVNKFDLYGLNFILRNNLAMVNCEASFMAIAMQNLLINATKYAKSEIIVATSACDEFYTIHVIDDGSGLPNNARALIEPFQQGERDNLASGYGLGLYIVKQIISWHGGFISLDNSVETGGADIAIRWPKSDK